MKKIIKWLLNTPIGKALLAELMRRLIDYIKLKLLQSENYTIMRIRTDMINFLDTIDLNDFIKREL